MGKLLTLDEVAVIVHLSKSRLKYLIQKGVIPVIKPGGENGKRTLVDEDDLNEYIKSCRFRYK